MSTPVSVLVTATIRSYRDGIAQALERDPRTEVAGTAGSMDDAITSLGGRRPDVVLVDSMMDEAIATVREVVRASSAVAVAVGLASEDRRFEAFARAGIVGFLTRDDSLEVFIDEILSVADPRYPCSPRMAAALIAHQRRPLAAPGGHHSARLTRREREILDLVAENLSNKQIAGVLSIQPATVKNHVHNILEKMEVEHRHEAAQLSGCTQVHAPGLDREPARPDP